jgi:uncharacterized protein (DUF1810 family)
MSDDPYHLARFIEAQDGVYPTALAELRAGRKRGHWMWFVFPQLDGLGSSPMARHFGLRSIDSARAYLAHPLLGARLRECLAALAAAPLTDPEALLGPIDAVKLRSSLTLFEAAGGGAAFTGALDRWYGGARDEATLAMLGQG